MTSSSGAWVSESKEVRLSRRFAIRASRDTRSPSGLIKTYSAAQIRPRVATSALRSASSYSRMDSRSSASALLVAAELNSCAVAAAGARRISARNDSKQSRFRIMLASYAAVRSLKHADVRIPYWRDRDRDTRDALRVSIVGCLLTRCCSLKGCNTDYLERPDSEAPNLILCARSTEDDNCSQSRHSNNKDLFFIQVLPMLCRPAPSAKYINAFTSQFQGFVKAQPFYIHRFADFADVHSRMLFESHCDAVFDVLPARWPPYLFALRLRLAGNGRLFDSNLLKFGRRRFDSPGDAIAKEFAACGPPDLFLLGFRLARCGRLF